MSCDRPIVLHSIIHQQALYRNCYWGRNKLRTVQFQHVTSFETTVWTINQFNIFCQQRVQNRATFSLRKWNGCLEVECQVIFLFVNWDYFHDWKCQSVSVICWETGHGSCVCGQNNLLSQYENSRKMYITMWHIFLSQGSLKRKWACCTNTSANKILANSTFFTKPYSHLPPHQEIGWHWRTNALASYSNPKIHVPQGFT
jgi:hypothetical protein